MSRKPTTITDKARQEAKLARSLRIQKLNKVDQHDEKNKDRCKRDMIECLYCEGGKRFRGLENLERHEKTMHAAEFCARNPQFEVCECCEQALLAESIDEHFEDCITKRLDNRKKKCARTNEAVKRYKMIKDDQEEKAYAEAEEQELNEVKTGIRELKTAVNEKSATSDNEKSMDFDTNTYFPFETSTKEYIPKVYPDLMEYLKQGLLSGKILPTTLLECIHANRLRNKNFSTNSSAMELEDQNSDIVMPQTNQTQQPTKKHTIHLPSSSSSQSELDSF